MSDQQQPDKLTFHTFNLPQWLPWQIRRVANLPEVTRVDVWDKQSGRAHGLTIPQDIIRVEVWGRSNDKSWRCVRELASQTLASVGSHDAIGDELISGLGGFVTVEHREPSYYKDRVARWQA